MKEHRRDHVLGMSREAKEDEEGGMAVKLQHKSHSKTLPCTRCPKGGRAQPTVEDNSYMGMESCFDFSFIVIHGIYCP
ncbi:MAG: hypothetical protein M8353_06115 [ANME-2 cluster archaeon]|nr:hypothetical protein [ANME-2 cluster archaeon]